MNCRRGWIVGGEGQGYDGNQEQEQMQEDSGRRRVGGGMVTSIVPRVLPQRRNVKGWSVMFSALL